MNHNCDRKGVFELNMCYMRMASWEELRALFDGIVVLDCRSNFATDKIEYWALSDHFKPVQEGFVPFYEPRIERQEGGAISVRWLMFGEEPEPEPITLNLPDLNPIRLAVDRVLNKYRLMDPVTIDVDAWIDARDWGEQCPLLGRRPLRMFSGGPAIAIGFNAARAFSDQIARDYRAQAAQPPYSLNPMEAANYVADSLQGGASFLDQALVSARTDRRMDALARRPSAIHGGTL